MSPGRKTRDTFENIWKQIKVDGTTGCWNWLGATRVGGSLPIVSINRKYVSVRRVLWGKYKEEIIPPKHELWSDCNNSHCVNPYHLFINTPENRFWSHVNVGGEDECWEWVGALNHHNYGNFTGFNSKHDKAHRFSYRIHYGDFDETMEILHSCDNPKCVNPRHLSVGTHKENMGEMVERGRSVNMRGENAHTNKLTRQNVIEIRNMYALGNISQAELGRMFGVSKDNIGSIVRNETWKWV